MQTKTRRVIRNRINRIVHPFSKRETRRRPVILGVRHAARDLETKKELPHLRRLYSRLKKLREEGKTRIGMEGWNYADRVKDMDDSSRYFRVARRLIKKMKMHPVSLEDPVLWSLHHRIDLMKTIAFRKTLGLRMEVLAQDAKYKENYAYLQRYFKKESILPEMIELNRAITYMRTLAMIRKARKEKVDVIIVGEGHTPDIARKWDFKIVHVDDRVKYDGETAYRKHKKLLHMLASSWREFAQRGITAY